MTKKEIHFEARLNRTIRRRFYTTTQTFKKGTLLESYSENEFKKMIGKSKSKTYCIVLGFGNKEYFSIDDVEFVKVTTVTKKSERVLKLKKTNKKHEEKYS